MHVRTDKHTPENIGARVHTHAREDVVLVVLAVVVVAIAVVAV